MEESQTPQKPLNQNKIETVEIDADGKVLGRLATEIAVILRGKNKTNFRPNIVSGEKVLVINASKIVLTGRKIEEKKYYHHTGYIGHLKETGLKELMQSNPSEVVRRAVYGMLPNNKLKKEWMKNLTVQN